jgi:hypothetical protein
MVPGAEGMLDAVTTSVCWLETPQAAFATTVIVPPVPVGVVVMLFVEDVPDQPPGNVHVYEVAPDTGVTLYVCATPLQTAVGPLMGPGAGAAAPDVTARLVGDDVRPQAFVAVTETVPLEDDVVTVMLDVVLLPVHPGGNVHVYVVFVGPDGTEYVSVAPAHTEVGPVIAPGAAAAEMGVTGSALAALVPQAVVAVTVTLPAEAPGVVVRLAVVEVPLQPAGVVQV